MVRACVKGYSTRCQGLSSRPQQRSSSSRSRRGKVPEILKKEVKTRNELSVSASSTRRTYALAWASLVGGWFARSLSDQDLAYALPLAPLGKVKRGDSYAEKKTGLSTEEVKAILQKALEDGQYFVNSSGLPREIFDNNCRFKDPTNDVAGLSRYIKALDLLFETESSEVKLLSMEVSGEKEIVAEYILGGNLKFPWKPCVSPYKGVVTYTLSSEDGLVVSQEQEWSISASEALKETFSPCRVKVS